jgi:sterol desaturase/sphingolipid hydroxylase (fatty acid hydroxylase superfamily)
MDARRTDVLKASPRMFESDLLDRLSRVHPAVPVLIFLPAIAVLAASALERMGALETLAWFAGGYVFWTLTEYWLHRVIFHFEPEDGVGARLHWIMHGVHHDHPNDPMRLVMPPSVSIPLSALFYLAFHVVLGGTYALAFGAGFLAGYLFYDMTHYYVHHFRPRSRLGRRLRQQHMRHHFQDDTRGFGVSAPWWDYVFGTAPRVRRDAH